MLDWKYVSGPSVLIAVGSLCVLVGAFWSSARQSIFQKKISEKNEEISNLNKKVVGLVTGGDSFCHMSIVKDGSRDVLSLVILHAGEFPLYDVGARLIDLDEFEKNKSPTIADINKNVLDIGNVAPNVAIPGRVAIPIRGRKNIRLNIFFSGRNGFYNQELRLQHINGEWRMATRVRTHDGEVKFKEIDPLLGSEDQFKF